MRVRATVHCLGVRPGETVEVDPEEPRVALLLERGLIVAEEDPESEAKFFVAAAGEEPGADAAGDPFAGRFGEDE